MKTKLSIKLETIQFIHPVSRNFLIIKKSKWRSVLIGKVLFSAFLFCVFSNGLKAENHPKRSKTISKPSLKNQPIDQLLQRIDAAHFMLNQFDDKANSQFNVEPILKELPRIESGMALVEKVISQKDRKVNVNNLQMYGVLLTDIEGQLELWRSNLLEFNKDLVTMNSDLLAFAQTRDSVFTKIKIDSNFRPMILSELNQLGNKYNENQEAILGGIKKINQLQARLSQLYYRTVELEDGIYDLNKDFWNNATHKEAPYLWENWSEVHKKNVSVLKAKIGSNNFILNWWGNGQQIILANYFLHNKTGYILLSILGILFFIWVFINFRKAQKTGISLNQGILRIHYLEPLPIVATLILILNITPFIDLDTPTLYFEILQFILILLLSYTFFKNWPKKYFKFWLGVLALYVSYSIIGEFHSISYWGVWASITLNIAGLIFGYLFLAKTRKENILSTFEKITIGIFTFCNLIALGLNFTSYLSLAEQICYAAIFGLSQALSLTIGFRILSEGIFLHAVTQREEATTGFVYEDNKIQKNLNTAFSVFVVIFWLISFTDNLNIFTPIYEGIENFLGVPRHIGNTTFAYGNVILFFLIISIANFIQKFLGFFLGENYGNNSQNIEFKKKGSRLAITRLLLLFIGFIIAVLASGLPVDRITILLGALGVGIGLGLQSIVNNLVSGIVLIFERPFRIGDLIEIGIRKGRVKEIGLRSTKLLTNEGSEVIIPNGDMLSEKVVNWTLTNDNARIEFEFKIPSESNLSLAKEIITKELQANPWIIDTQKPEILVYGMTDTLTILRVGVWITNINEANQFRSDFLNKLYPTLHSNQIQLRD